MTTEKKLRLRHVHLPEDIIVNNILCRLPVKSLNRFRCVSKRWRCLISDPEFAKSHLKMAYEQGTLIQRHLVSVGYQIRSLDFEAQSFGDESVVRNLTFPTLSKSNQPPECANLLGSCNGLVFVALDGYKSLYLWNPSTSFVRKIPNPDFVTRATNPQSTHYSIYGLGYVSATDDYKILASGYVASVEVFSLRSNSWKSIEQPRPISLFCHGLGVLTNEALHWFYREKEPTIFAFDLELEEFRHLPLPILSEDDDNDDNDDDDDIGQFRRLQVHVLSGGCLCVSFWRELSMEFWVMTEYEVRRSWTTLIKFNMGIQSCDDEPVFVAESGTVVFKSRSPWGCHGRVGYRHKHLMRIEGLKEEKQVFCGPCSLNMAPGCHMRVVCRHKDLMRIEGLKEEKQVFCGPCGLNMASGCHMRVVCRHKDLMRIEGLKEEKQVFCGPCSLNKAPVPIFDVIQYHETLHSVPEMNYKYAN